MKNAKVVSCVRCGCVTLDRIAKDCSNCGGREFDSKKRSLSCSHCAACMIQGMLCHEKGCYYDGPDVGKIWDDCR